MHDNLAKTHILIIDDFAQFRQTLKTMLYRLGAQQVDQASNGIEAVKLSMENSYDIIFCDYNLGDGQDGQQILEELHHRSILQKGRLFLMVTAETTSAQVMGAIEYRPDAYLTKPFTNEQLGQRLKRLIKKNETLKDIHQAINRGELNLALQQCDSVMQQTPTERFSCLRLKSEILEKQKKYDQAMVLYQEVIQQQPLLWAVLGIGRLYFIQGNVDKALQHFEQMREDFPQQVSVLDWIAKCQQQLGENEQAENTLKQATEISPKSISRQATLGAIAESLDHHDIAQKAFEKTIHEGYHSCLLEADHYQHYFANTQQLASILGDSEQNRILATSEAMAKRMERKYQNNPGSMARNLSSLVTLFSSLGKHSQSDHFLSRLSSTLNNPECRISLQDFNDIQQELNALEGGAINEKILNKVSSRLQVIEEEINTRQGSELSAKEINREGMNLARQNQHHEALEKFRQSIELAPYHTNYALNAVQTILLSEELRNDPQLLNEARSHLASLSLENSGQRWRLYKKLMTLLPDD